MINEAEIKEFNILYPLYIDKKFPVSKGRRTILKNSIENPTVEEFKLILDSLNIPNQIEKEKRHPCDFFRYGRLRYKLISENGEFYNSDYKTSILKRKNIIKFII